jgi:hypothetical protein
MARLMSRVKTATDIYLVPAQTTVEANGEGPIVELNPASARLFTCRLHLAAAIEQESLDVSVWGSPDSSNWGQQPILKLPQQFYPGEAALVLDLTQRPEVKFLRARWDVNRWGRGRPVPFFRFSLRLEPTQP